MAGELLEFPHDVFGMVLNLERGPRRRRAVRRVTTEIKEGDQVARTGRIIQVPVGER